MATALAAPQQLRSMKQVQSGVLAWYEWRDAGKGPKTRDEGLRIISSHMGMDFTRCRESLARSIKNQLTEEETINDRISFIVWDIRENDASLFNYRNTLDRILADLLAEAGNLIRTYTRVCLNTKRLMKSASESIRRVERAEAPTVKESPIYGPTIIREKGRGYQKVVDLNRETLERQAQDFITYAVRSLVRWKAYGADPNYIKATLREIEKRVTEEL